VTQRRNDNQYKALNNALSSYDCQTSYIIYNQDFGEPKVAYDILSKELKNFVGSYLY